MDPREVRSLFPIMEEPYLSIQRRALPGVPPRHRGDTATHGSVGVRHSRPVQQQSGRRSREGPGGSSPG